MIQTAPLRLFRLSPLNARKIYTQPELDELAGSIERFGILQNVDAVAGEDGSGMLEVVAGGRRLRALWQLLDQERADITVDSEVPYRLVDADVGREVSLEENTQKIALNPVDEIDAYVAIVGAHADVPDPVVYCATRMDKTERHVRQMLRLAKLAPEVLDALRAGTIGVTAARAYASVDDQDAQRVVFEGEERRQFGPHNPRNIREALAGRTIPASDARATYVGIDAYRAAGGRVDRDLFLGADAGELLLDPAILNELARAKAEAALPARAAADGLTSGLLTTTFTAAPIWPKPPALGRWLLLRAALGIPCEPKPGQEVLGVYTLAQDGSGLELLGWMFDDRPELPSPAPSPFGTTPLPIPGAPEPSTGAEVTAVEQTIKSLAAFNDAVRSFSGGSIDPGGRAPHRDETAAQVIARYRERDLQRVAGQLAVRRLIQDHRLEERLQLCDPAEAVDDIEAIDEGFLVTIQILVSAAEIEDVRASAEAELAGDPAADAEPAESEPAEVGGGGHDRTASPA